MKKLIEQITWEVSQLGDTGESAAAFIALEITLQDLARVAHAEAERTVQS